MPLLQSREIYLGGTLTGSGPHSLVSTDLRTDLVIVDSRLAIYGQ
jgi:hypothetical protein